jgi:hypothetical protein
LFQLFSKVLTEKANKKRLTKSFSSLSSFHGMFHGQIPLQVQRSKFNKCAHLIGLRGLKYYEKS